MERPKDHAIRFPWIFVIFLLGLGCRLVYFFQCDSCPMLNEHYQIADSKYFDLWAKAIAGGDLVGREAFFMAPLYPYFLGVVYALFGSDFLWVRLIQTLMGSLTCVGVYLLGCRLFHRKIALLASLFSAVYGLFFFYENMLLAAGLLVFLSLLCAIFLTEAYRRQKPLWWFWAGILMGLCALGKANMLLAVPIVVIWIYDQNRKRGVRRGTLMALWFLLGTVFCVLPVTIRNMVVQEDFVLLTSNGGLNLFLGNHEEAEGVWVRVELPYAGSTLYHHITALANGTRAYGDLKPSEVSSVLKNKAFRFAKEEPMRFLALLGKKFMLSINAYEVGNRDNFYFAKEFSWLLRLPLFGFGILAPFAFVGLLACLGDPRRYFVPLLFVAVPALTLVIIFVLARYRLPAVPFLCLLAAKGIFSLWGAFRPLKPWRLGAMIVACILAFVAVHWPMERLDVKTQEHAVYASYGRFLADQGDLDRAMAALKRAVELDPSDVGALFTLARVYEAMEQLGAAEKYYREAVRRGEEEESLHKKRSPLLRRARQRLSRLQREEGSQGADQ